MRRRNVLYILHCADGGATRSCLDIVQALEGRPLRLHALVHGRDDAPLVVRLRELGVEIRTVFMPWWNLKHRLDPLRRVWRWSLGAARSRMHLRTVAAMRRAIREWEIDLVHSNCLQVADGAVAARLEGRRHVWHLREAYGPGAHYAYPVPRRLMPRLVHRSSIFSIANSENTRSGFVCGAACPHVRLLYNCVRDTSELPREPSDRVTVAMVASLSSELKGHDRFVRIARRVREREPRAAFAIVGRVPADSAYVRRLREEVARSGPEGWLELRGHQEGGAQVFRDVDVLVHPTPNEGFGRVVAEAQVRGVPAVVAWEGGAREIVEEGTTGYSIRGGDEEAFASAVARLVADRELRARLGAAARARARGMFGHDAFGERLRSLYDEALDGLT